MSDNDKNVLSVRGLSTRFCGQRGEAEVVGGVGFSIKRGETFAVVGESGCGKSVTALSIMRLVPKPAGKIVSGEILFDGEDILSITEKKMCAIRGSRIAMIFQDPVANLNPVFTLGDQITEVLRVHRGVGKAEARKEALELLYRVGIDRADERFDAYPHELSGGMAQRVMIAMAVICRPELLIADEPTTGLDVTVGVEILDLLDGIQKQNNMSIMLITHDLRVVAERADSVGVMYASKIVERADGGGIFKKALHPYTQGLLRSLPGLRVKEQRLFTIGGEVADPWGFPSGCKFHPRCSLCCGDRRCQEREPELREICDGHFVACWKAEGYCE